jgi:HlyD family secretion protein
MTATESSTATAQTPIGDTASPQKRRRPFFLIPIGLLLIGFGVWKLFFSHPALPDSIVALSGRIEGDDSAISAKTSGRVMEIRFREGDSVKAGDSIAILDDQQVREREDQARAAVAQSEAQLRSAQDQIAVLNEQLAQTQLESGQATIDAGGRVNQAQAELSAAEADLAQQRASLQLALFDRDAYTRLAKTGAVSERQGKQAETTAASQQAIVDAAERRLEAARGALNIAKANLSNPGIRNAQSSAIRKQLLQQQAAIANARAEEVRSQAQLAEATSNRGDLIVRAPFDGTVVTRSAEPGEYLQAGTPIVTLLDLTKVYLRGYIPEGQIGKVKLGQPGRVYLDSNPTKPVDAEVSRIDPSATFTPENTYFRDDRVKQVVGVKLRLKGSFGFAKPGMPADGEVLVSGDQWPARSTHQ